MTTHKPGHRPRDSGTATTTSENETADQHVFLIGRPPVGEFLGFISAQTVGGADADVSGLMEEWRKANDHVRQLERSEAGFANNPPIWDLPDDLIEAAAAVRTDPIFRRSFSFVPSEIKLVDVDRLVVYQKSINLAFVRTIQDRVQQETSMSNVFRLCLPTEREVPPAKVQRVAQNVYVFISPSNDLRFVEPILLQPQHVGGYLPYGPMLATLGLVVGFSSNYVQAVAIDDRIVLHNGSHRVYALRELGIKQVPCVIQKATRRDELEVVGSAELQANSDRFLKEPRPPLLKDYFDPALRKIVRVPHRARQVRISFGVESTDTPES